jgi:hypothetical protein
MKYIIIFIYLSFILLIQIDQQQAVPIDRSSSDDNQNYPLSWYNTINDIEDLQYQRPINNYYKRFLHELILPLPERHRRFGNTKYGRSLPNE